MHAPQKKKKDIIAFFLKRGVLVSQDLLEAVHKNEHLEEIEALLEQNRDSDITVLNTHIRRLLNKRTTVNWSELEQLKARTEKANSTAYDRALQTVHELDEKEKTPVPQKKDVTVLFSYEGESKKREPQDFVDYFKCRYRALQTILKQRQTLQNAVSINRLYNKRDRDQIAIIGMVRDKQYTKNGNCMLTIEDETAYTKALINKTKPDLFETTKDIVLDEVIGISGVNGDNIIFVNNLYFPETPLSKEIKKAHDEVYAIFLSDLHVGSKNFLEQDFTQFLKWINGELGSEAQKAIAKKVKYVFILGDLVDGCGVYPDQHKEQTINDIKEQYARCAQYLDQIPKDKHIIIIPGNHDAMRVPEPQLPFYKDFAEPLYHIENATILSNPSLVNIHASETFPGFDVLIYHGYSFDFYIAEVESIRNNGGYDRADLIMKFLLQKRHLAPTHTSTLYVPDTKADPLVITRPPDFFVSGHIHKSAAANYRNTTLISGSCWQSKTAFQEKVGHHPEPSRVPIVNLQTRDIKLLKFGP